MILLLFILAFPVLEIYVLVKVGSVLGFWQTLAYVFLMGFFGISLIKAQGRAMLFSAQKALARGEVPSDAPLQVLLVILGGILFLIPGIISDALGLLCVLPGTRHLLALTMRAWLAAKLAKGQAFVFGKMRDFGAQAERDVTPKVIDITPIHSTTEDGEKQD